MEVPRLKMRPIVAVNRVAGISTRLWARPAVVLWILIIFHAVSNVTWLTLDDRLPNWDPARHLMGTLRAWEAVQSPGQDMLSRLSRADAYEPPLVYVATLPLYVVLGISADVATYNNTLFLGILIWATYGLAKILYSPHVGLLAAFLVSFYPLVVGYTRIYYLDLPLAAIVTANLYFLLKTRDFSNRPASLLYGLTLATGLLTKRSFVIFAVVPTVLVIGRAVFQVEWKDAFRCWPRIHLAPRIFDRVVNIGLAIVLGTALALPWYLDQGRLQILENRIKRIISDFRVVSDQVDSVAADGIKRPLWWYATWLDDNLFSVGLGLFLVGSFMSLLRRDRRAIFPFAWFAGSFILHSIVARGHPRYILPLFPAIAILSVGWLAEIRRFCLRPFFLLAIVVSSFINYAIFSWYDPSPATGQLEFECPSKFYQPCDPRFYRPFEQFRNANLFTVPKAIYHAYPPRRLAWPIDNILDTVWTDYQASHTQPAKPTSIWLGANMTGFNFATMGYFIKLRQTKANGVEIITVRDAYHHSYNDLSSLLDSPYVVTKSGDLSLGSEDFAVAFRAICKTLPDRFEVVQSFPLPDGTEARLYRRAQPRPWEFTDFTEPLQVLVQILQEVLKTIPNNSDLHIALGDVYVALARSDLDSDRMFYFDLAKAEYDAVLTLDPGNGEAHTRLGDLYWEQEQWEMAIYGYKTAVELDPTLARAYTSLGNIYLAQDQVGAAIALYESAARHNPGAAWPHLELGKIYLSQGIARVGDETN